MTYGVYAVCVYSIGKLYIFEFIQRTNLKLFALLQLMKLFKTSLY